MGGKAVSERMNAFAFFNAAFLLGEVIDFLRRTDVQRATSVLTKENPGHRLISLLVSLQFTEQPLGENRVAVFFPFTLFHPDHHPLWIDITELEVD